MAAYFDSNSFMAGGVPFRTPDEFGAAIAAARAQMRLIQSQPEFGKIRAEVTDLLKKRLDAPHVAFEAAALRIAHEVFNYKQTGRVRLLGESTNTLDPDFLALRTAVAAVVQIAPKIIKKNDALLADAERRGLSDKIGTFRDATEQLRSFHNSAEKILPSMGSGRKGRDSEDRSKWHGVAKYFAAEIRRDLKSANLNRSTRKIGRAVQEVLWLIDVKPLEETVRKQVCG